MTAHRSPAVWWNWVLAAPFLVVLVPVGLCCMCIAKFCQGVGVSLDRVVGGVADRVDGER